MVAKKKLLLIPASVLVIAVISILSLAFFPKKDKKPIAGTVQIIENISPTVEKKEILQETKTILLLGLDSRKGDQEARCDAIHFITFSPEKGKIIITSVPRNARVDLPEVPPEDSYLANVCEKKGIEEGIREITRIAGLRQDYVIKINFSQTLGILRLLGLPTTPALQFLRDRTSYMRGGYQRSHNQALFIKDMVLNHSEKAADFPDPLKKIIFKMADTGKLDYDTAYRILNWIDENKFWEKPERIEIVIKPRPWYKTLDLHFAASDYPTADSWQNSKEFQEYQSDLIKYMQDLVIKGEKYIKNNQKTAAYNLLKTPFSQQLWLQVENDRERDRFHFELLKLYASSAKDKKEAAELLSDFISEMEVAGNKDLKNQAEEMKTVLDAG